jgi:hypothetical protein
MGLFFAAVSRPSVGLTQPLIHWILGAFTPEVKLQGREADHSFPLAPRSREREAIPPFPNMSS